MNIPKKLPTNSQNYGSEVKLELVRIKVEEIISYLQAKEEASNYKIVSFDPVGETVPEASKGECICSENSWRSDCPYPHTKNPPEHEEYLAKLIKDEEDLDKLTEDLVNISDWRGNLSINDVFDYIQANFEPKRKKHE